MHQLPIPPSNALWAHRTYKKANPATPATPSTTAIYPLDILSAAPVKGTTLLVLVLVPAPVEDATPLDAEPVEVPVAEVPLRGMKTPPAI